MRKFLLIVTILFSFSSFAQTPLHKLIRKKAATSNPDLIGDSLTSATIPAVYSFRKVFKNYAGNCVRVYNGTTSQDFGFVNDFVDTAGIKIFIGANDAKIDSFYNQNGTAGRTMYPASNRPKMGTAGVLYYNSGELAIYLTDNTYRLRTPNYQAYPDSMVINGVYKVIANASFNTTTNKAASNKPSPLDNYNASFFVGDGTNLSSVTMSETFNVAQGQVAWTVKGGGIGTNKGLAWRNTTNINSHTTGYYGDTNCALVIGSRGDAVTGGEMAVYEVWTFSIISAADLTKLQNNQIVRYGL